MTDGVIIQQQVECTEIMEEEQGIGNLTTVETEGMTKVNETHVAAECEEVKITQEGSAKLSKTPCNKWKRRETDRKCTTEKGNS